MDHAAVVLEGQGVQHDLAGEVVTAIFRLVTALIALKLVVLALDSTIRVYLGDSAAYLFGAMDSGRLPDDRSFTYSLLIRGLVRPFDDLLALVVWQTIAGVIVALLTWHLMVDRLRVRRTIAGVASCLLALDPGQLYYERMVLAETFGLLAFALFIAAVAAYLASGRTWWLPLAALLGLASATLRLNYLPVVVVISLAAPALTTLQSSKPSWRRIAAHSAVALVSVVVLHGTFQTWVAWIFKSPPGYIARAGFMQLGLVMPLVKPEHLEAVGLPRTLGQSLQYPIADPNARMRHMWAPGGFIRVLRDRNVPIEPVARSLVSLALRDDPMGLVRLGIHTVGDYFREEGIAHALSNDLGRRVIPDEILWTLREIWNYEATGLWTRVTPVSRYFEYGSWWLVACLFLLLPLSIVNAVRYWRSPVRVQVALVVLVSTGLVGAHVLFVPVAFYRYLHPLPMFVLINVGLIVGSFRSQAPGTRRPAPRA